MTYTRSTAFAVLGLAAALSLTACNGDTSGASSANSSSSSAPSPSSKDGSSKDGSSNGGGSSSGNSKAASAKSGSGYGSGTSAENVGVCKSGDLVWSAKDDKPDEKNGNIVVTMTNAGSTTCSVTGFPDVFIKDEDTTSNPISHASNQPRIANLAPGAVGGFTISYEIDNSGSSLTSPTNILVTPPNGTTQVSLNWPAGDIKGSYNDVEVHPIHTPF